MPPAIRMALGLSISRFGALGGYFSRRGPQGVPSGRSSLVGRRPRSRGCALSFFELCAHSLVFEVLGIVKKLHSSIPKLWRTVWLAHGTQAYGVDADKGVVSYDIYPVTFAKTGDELLDLVGRQTSSNLVLIKEYLAEAVVFVEPVVVAIFFPLLLGWLKAFEVCRPFSSSIKQVTQEQSGVRIDVAFNGQRGEGPWSTRICVWVNELRVGDQGNASGNLDEGMRHGPDAVRSPHSNTKNHSKKMATSSRTLHIDSSWYRQVCTHRCELLLGRGEATETVQTACPF
ncbi:hypothetical protein KCU81_g848, partial [Aureobasidium melanogenum]